MDYPKENDWNSAFEYSQGVPKSELYNGYENYQTWSVAMSIAGSESLYRIARPFRFKGYRAFVKALEQLDTQLSYTNQHGVSWTDPELDVDALDDLLTEL